MASRAHWRQRRHTVQAGLVAALASAALAASACSPTAIDGSPHAAIREEPIPPPRHQVAARTEPSIRDIPTDGTISPGGRIILPFDRAAPGTCTAGFLVHLTDGRTGVMSAGHCQYPGAEVQDAAGRAIGTYMYSIDQGKRATDIDTALIVLNPGLQVDSWILESTAVTGVSTVSDLTSGRKGVLPAICYVGATTGASTQCGTIANIEGDKLVMWAPEAKPGDSGGPVYAQWPDGSRSAVGTLLGSGNTKGTIVATLLEPWLDKWGLKLK